MMRKTLVVLGIFGALLAPRAAWAYIDPGTTHSLFTFLAPILALLGVFLGYLVWPFRYVVLRLFRKPRKRDGAPSGDLQEPPKSE